MFPPYKIIGDDYTHCCLPSDHDARHSSNASSQQLIPTVRTISAISEEQSVINQYNELDLGCIFNLIQMSNTDKLSHTSSGK